MKCRVSGRVRVPAGHWAYVGFFRHFVCVCVFVVVFVFVFVSSYDFWIAFIIIFQNMYGYRGLWGLQADIMIIFKVMTDTQTDRQTDRISSCRLDPFCRRGRVKILFNLCQPIFSPSALSVKRWCFEVNWWLLFFQQRHNRESDPGIYLEKTTFYQGNKLILGVVKFSWKIFRAQYFFKAISSLRDFFQWCVFISKGPLN